MDWRILTRVAITVAIVLFCDLWFAKAQIANPSFRVDRDDTALVIVDPQVDFLSETGATWKYVGKTVKSNQTVQNIEALLTVAKANEFLVFISPHYYYPWDHKWASGGPGEVLLRGLKPFDRKGPLTLEGFSNSGADWMPQYKRFINDGQTVIASPHKLYGPEVNDLVLQLRKRRVTRVILAGMSANLCIESHLRYLLEQGFEVGVVKDATAAFQLPGADGYAAALTNFRMIANAVMTTEELTATVHGHRASGK
ncbi:MAG TPA: cysteine hydrolase [Bryobacteraceae bacterium]|nr:cysteine hydrolase [Bryobacteraceae bacterium]